jgi:hypothetical protein
MLTVIEVGVLKRRGEFKVGFLGRNRYKVYLNTFVGPSAGLITGSAVSSIFFLYFVKKTLVFLL